MDTKLKEEWVAALRSGKYQQGTEVLRDEFKEFCCLGVLCEIDPEVTWSENDAGYKYKEEPDRLLTTQFDDGDDYQESPLLEKYGITVQIQEVLIRLNDEEQLDFNGIADFIEEGL